MTWLWLIFALLLVIDAWRIRGRAQLLKHLPASEEPVASEHQFLVAQGVELDEETKRAASAYARQHGLKVLDLVPLGLPTMHAWMVFQMFDPGAYRKDRIGRGVSFGHASLVHADVLTAASIVHEKEHTALDLIRAISSAKRYACTQTDLVIAPGLRATRTPKDRFLIFRELAGDGANLLLIGIPLILAIIATAGVTGGSFGLAVVASFHLQPLLAFVGSALRTQHLLITTVFRSLLDTLGWLGLVRDAWRSSENVTLLDQRTKFESQLAGGLDRFFEARIDDCPVCGGKSLGRYLTTGDLLQGKPGRFRLERCSTCRHIFQNPRLSIEGLNFYYADFYDGLGAENLDRIFGSESSAYLKRANMVLKASSGPPDSWLDVGAGQGHFCCAAREVCPKTRFDALDLSESIEEAIRRGWVDKGFRGLFPDLAPTMRGTYNVVSMSHYLEHTRDPAAEIEAASIALMEGGLLLIEVPDPECPMRFFGRLWLPHFQPQHQHLLSVTNLQTLLTKRGFEPLVWHRGEAHQRVDFVGAAILVWNWIAPTPGMPWRRSWGAWSSLWRLISFILLLPAVIFGRLIDELIGPWIERRSGSNTYRVLARKASDKAR